MQQLVAYMGISFTWHPHVIQQGRIYACDSGQLKMAVVHLHDLSTGDCLAATLSGRVLPLEENIHVE